MRVTGARELLRRLHDVMAARTPVQAKLDQVAGLIARRIICHVQADDRVRRGQRFGMICFGSRLDVYLPSDISLTVSVGDKVRAGTSILGCFTTTDRTM